MIYYNTQCLGGIWQCFTLLAWVFFLIVLHAGFRKQENFQDTYKYGTDKQMLKFCINFKFI